MQFLKSKQINICIASVLIVTAFLLVMNVVECKYVLACILLVAYGYVVYPEYQQATTDDIP